MSREKFYYLECDSCGAHSISAWTRVRAETQAEGWKLIRRAGAPLFDLCPQCANQPSHTRIGPIR